MGTSMPPPSSAAQLLDAIVAMTELNGADRVVEDNALTESQQADRRRGQRHLFE